MTLLECLTDSAHMSLSRLQEMKNREAWRAAVRGVAELDMAVTELQQQDTYDIKINAFFFSF